MTMQTDRKVYENGDALLADFYNDIHEANEMAAFFCDMAGTIGSGDMSSTGCQALARLLYEQTERLDRFATAVKELRQRQGWRRLDRG